MPTLVAKLSRPKAIAEVKVAAASCFSQAVVAARVHDEQGCFSLTLVVTLENEDGVIVQCRDCKIDLLKVALVRSLLGPVVPNIQSGKAPNVAFAYVANLIPGTLGQREALSTVVVDRYIVPRPQKILEMEDFSDTPEACLRFESSLNLDRVAELKSLPLALCHIDVNHRNVTICGLIDWEHANLLPLAMNVWSIRFLSVTIAGGNHLPNERTIPMAEAFWNAFINGLPPSQRSPAHKRAVYPQEFVDIFDWLEVTFSKLCV
ncbi:hypothetical protein ARMGADRAFT_1044068 [Armillaria gallica]|uniref:Aminoglycoside phosphotransferase domain-containing protein n=1 Tax=Armillaria gallica TaxID=47427 RepID=A0A2H3DTC5_ARMGA|nr:hypothetical protein ARMGADRAFT_1044068 [Armillaria gallica]